jgi:hypothetical protein
MCQADQADAALEVLACYVKHDYKELTARQEFVLTYLLTYLLTYNACLPQWQIALCLAKMLANSDE